MRIKSITLSNFKSYYGTQEIRFENGMNIISGSIGTGKTSLFEAFQWLLLDNNYHRKYIDKDYILNSKHLFESRNKKTDFIEAEVLLTIDNNDGEERKFTKKNTYKLNEGNYTLYNSSLTVSYQDRIGNTEIKEDQNDVERELDTSFPSRIREYLLFKGESLDKLIDFSNEQTLEKAVNQISYLPIFKKMNEITTSIKANVSKRYDNNLKSLNRDNNKFKQLSIELEEKESKLEDKEKQKNQIESEISDLKSKESEYIAQLAMLAGFPELQSKQINLKNDLQNIYSTIERLDNESKSSFINKWILVKSENLLDEAEISLREFIEKRQKLLNSARKELEIGIPGDHLINQMIKEKKCLICGTTEEQNSTIIEHIKQHLDENKKSNQVLDPETEDMNEKVMDIKRNIPSIKASINTIRPDIINYNDENDNLLTKKTKVQNELENVNEKIDYLIKEKGSSILSQDANLITNSLKNIRQQIDTKSSSIQRIIYDINELNDRIGTIKKSLDNIAIKEDIDVNNLPEKICKDYLLKLNDIIGEREGIEKKNLIKKIENEANQIQKGIVLQPGNENIVVVYVKISSDFEISFVDSNGNPNPSHGAQITLAQLSLISAVLKLSSDYKKEDYSFVVDAPVSNFDDTIIKPFIQSLSENFAQVIIILKDINDEIDDYRKEDFVDSIYKLEKISDNGVEEASMTDSYTRIKELK